MAHRRRSPRGGRSLVVSGDTARTEAVAREARGVDLLIHEASSPRLSAIFRDAAIAGNRPGVARILDDIQTYHTPPEEAALLAQEAGAGALALTHLIPPLVLPGHEAAFPGDARERFSGPIWLMQDGDLISLPSGGGMQRSHRLN